MSLNKIFINNSDTNYTHSIFDITQHTGISYENLSAALAAVPDGKKSGGMTVRYVLNSDNKYVQYRLMANTFTTDVSQWQGVDDEPTTGSNNLVKSEGVFDMLVGTVKFIDGAQTGWNAFKHYVQDIFVFNADTNQDIRISYVWYNRDNRENNFGIQLTCFEIGGNIEQHYNYDIDAVLLPNNVYKLNEELGNTSIEVYIRTTSNPTTLSGTLMESTDYQILPTGYANLTDAVRKSAINYADGLFSNVNKTIRITDKSQLADINNASVGIIYQLNFQSATTSANLPANLPFDIWGNNSIASLFTYKDGNYGCQYLISPMAIFYRIYVGQQYYDWVMLTKPKEVTVGFGGDYTSLLYALKYTSPSVPIRILKDTTIDVVSEYESIYGNGFWENYNGYESQDPYMRGLWINDGRELYGEENVVLHFPYNGDNHAVCNAFSILAMGKNSYVHDLSIQVNNNCEYHIHDDWFSGNTNYSEMKYERIKFYGNSYSNICIGGGLGGRCKYIIKDCLFLTGTADAYNVSYHGNGNLTDAYCEIYVHGCYGQGQLVFRKMGPSLLTTECIVHDCKFSKIDIFNYDPEQPKDSMRLIAFNNTETGVS